MKSFGRAIVLCSACVLALIAAVAADLVLLIVGGHLFFLGMILAVIITVWLIIFLIVTYGKGVVVQVRGDPQQLLAKLLDENVRLRSGFDGLMDNLGFELQQYLGGARQNSEQHALRNLIEDATALTTIASYVENSRYGWSGVFDILRNIRLRLLICKSVLANSPLVSDQIRASINSLLATLKVFETLTSLWYEFAIIGASSSWEEEPAARLEIAHLQEIAKELMKLLKAPP
jgi:hypothetical protein